MARSLFPLLYLWNTSHFAVCLVICVEFPTSSAELGVVFSLFDSHKLGRIYYKDFVDTVMRPDKQVRVTVYCEGSLAVACGIMKAMSNVKVRIIYSPGMGSLVD